MNKKISIRDIAALAGVSVSSVSRILNKTGRYSKETEQKVLKIVEEYGYTANMSAKSLRSAKTRTISLMVPDITNEFFSRIAYYCETFLHEKGYTLFICNTNNHPEKEETYLNDFVSKNVDGIIAISYLTNIPKSLENSRLPVVTLDRIAKGTHRIPYVINDEYQAAFDATELLIRRGCRHIVALIPLENCNPDHPRLLGFLAARKEHLPGNSFHEPYFPIELSDHSNDDSERLVLELLESRKNLDGIFCGSDRIALGASRAVAQSGRRMPDDIKIIGFDNSLYSRLAVPPISTIGRNSRTLSIKACEMLLELIDHPGKIICPQMIPTRVIERDSTG
ncbi:MAG: LacI family transcriptional regulator [Hungatella sp.]|nr:LacI family transcriptional regulator [Hungatella sp.]